MKKAKSESKQAYITVDKLFIDGVQYVIKPETVEPAANAAAGAGTTGGATASTGGPA